jgi:Fis family transcriptional regulator
MSRAEPLPSLDSVNAANDEQQTAAIPSLRDSVNAAVSNYLTELDGQMSTDVYLMAYTRNNQTKASIMLGLNRGTLRKKLKQYNLISRKS